MLSMGYWVVALLKAESEKSEEERKKLKTYGLPNKA
jgi:hypothetical protein